jgi:hypothetical protein
VAFAALFIAIGGLVVAVVDEPEKSFIQNGVFAWDLYEGALLTTLPSTYRLYQGGSHYILELDPPATELTVPNGAATASAYVQVRMHTFVPAVIPLASFGVTTTVFPLSQENLGRIITDGLCYDPPTITCNIAARQGQGNLTQNSVAALIEGQKGYLTFYMQTIANSSQNWGNYTLGISSTLRLSLWSA